VLFSESVRHNIDPFDEYADEAIWQALDDVQLKTVVERMPLGLESMVSEGGGNLSVGQRQLVCLARAILRASKVILLDEATANVDKTTDRIIQQTIRRKFKGCTVITIAHRLNTIMDSDRILVMDFGRVVEFDSPANLMLRPGGHFASLVNQAKASTSEQSSALSSARGSAVNLAGLGADGSRVDSV
jgi:ATP-binding cassette subfamily C (CFTR/MRP) protein 4